MTDKEFTRFLDALSAHLASEKNFIVNPFRLREFEQAMEMAKELYPNAKVYASEDPLEMGAMILNIEEYDLGASFAREIKLFKDIIFLADNFEIRTTSEPEMVRLAALFNNVFIRV